MIWTPINDHEVEALREINTLSDRAAAILAAAMVDDRLGYVLKLSLHNDPTITQEMFRTSGPLGSFSAKINLGFQIGLYGRDFHRDLKYIKDIINAFAHQVKVRAFSSQTVIDHCKRLRLVEAYVFESGLSDENTPQLPFKLFEPNLSEALNNPRARYLLSIRLVLLMITPQTDPPDHRPRPPPF